MSRSSWRVLTVLAAGLAVVLWAAVASAAPPEDKGNGNGPKLGKDDLKHPRGEKQRKLKEKALAMKLAGKVPASAKVVKVGNGAHGQYVELAREGEDSIFTILGEFGPDAAVHAGHPSHAGPAGPLHNQIPQPDRSVDNTTIWAPDFNNAHYERILFSEAYAPSMRNLYIELSSNRYTVNGDVTDWVQVPYNAASYGSDYCGSIVCRDTWLFVNDSADAWYARALASLGSAAAVDTYLAQFDVWDRYDADGDGNFNESDGYIDHFQSVHAGMGQEVGGGAQGSNAIWSHRWYAWFSANGPDGSGPSGFGGLRIGDSSYWIGDYTIEPENGGVGVFAHEFAHDLGLPDLYATAGGENSTGWWTLMSQGSYGGDGGPDGIGTMGMQMGAWEKLVLGWLNYEYVPAVAKNTEHKLGPSYASTKQAQALIVGLPASANPTTVTLADPPEGEHAWWSGMGDNLDNTMARAVAAGATLTAKLWYDIEEDWDYFYAQASTDGGASWTNLPGNLTTNTDPNGQNFGNGITGSSGGAFVDASWTVPAGTTHIRFRYWTDPFVQGQGVLIDQIVTGSFTDGAESSPNGWTLNGFTQSTGSETRYDPHYYIGEYRTYRGFDFQLRTAPYNFGFLNTRPNWVEHFPYQDGLMINYWDTYYGDNNATVHPGQGLILPIDAHPAPMLRPDGSSWRCRVQSYDSTFGLEATDAITLHVNGVQSPQSSQPAVPVFNDNQTFYSAATPGCGVNHPHTGTRISVKDVTAEGFMQVQVAPAS